MLSKRYEWTEVEAELGYMYPRLLTGPQFYGQLRLIRSVLRASTFLNLKSIEIVIVRFF